MRNFFVNQLHGKHPFLINLHFSACFYCLPIDPKNSIFTKVDLSDKVPALYNLKRLYKNFTNFRELSPCKDHATELENSRG